MKYVIAILLLCLSSVAFSHPRNDEHEEQSKPRFGFFGDDFENIFQSSFRQFNEFMKSISDMFRRQINNASEMVHNWGKGFGFNFGDDEKENYDIIVNSTINSTESHTEQVGNNYVITNITRLDKVDKHGKKYRVIIKNVRVKPINGGGDILNSDRTYVVMDSDIEQQSEHQNNEEETSDISSSVATIRKSSIKGKLSSEAPMEELSSEAPMEKLSSEAPMEELSSEAPMEELSSEAPKEEWSSKAPKAKWSSEAPKAKWSSEARKEKWSSEAPKRKSSRKPPKQKNSNEASEEQFKGEKEGEKSTKKPWEKVDRNVMFDNKKNQVVADMERNDIAKK